MALTAKQKHDVLFRLGWSGKTLDPGSTHFSNIIADRLENLSIPMQSTVVGLLKRLDAIQEQMDEARCRMTAETVDGIKLNKDEAAMLKKEFKRYMKELSTETSVPIVNKSSINIPVSI